MDPSHLRPRSTLDGAWLCDICPKEDAAEVDPSTVCCVGRDGVADVVGGAGCETHYTGGGGGHTQGWTP